jgi:hypothetical protein
MPCPHGRDPKYCVVCRGLAIPQQFDRSRPNRTNPLVALPVRIGRGHPPIVQPVAPRIQRQPVELRPPPPPPRLRNGPAHLEAFTTDLKSRTTTFTRKRSSILGLLEYLEQEKDNPLPFPGSNEQLRIASARSKCHKSHDPRLTKYEPAIKALVKVWGSNLAYTPVQVGMAFPQVRGGSLVDNANTHRKTWSVITITDRPTGEFDSHNRPIYDYSHLKDGQAPQVESDGATAAGWALGGKPGDHQVKPAYWLKLGKLALNRKLGKCFSCAAAAVYTLVHDPNFDRYRIEVVGCADTDHYIVVVGRSGGRNRRVTLQRNPYLGIGPASGWGAAAIVVDIWQANHNNEVPAKKATDCIYTKEANVNYPRFCCFEPSERKAHRELVT